MTKKDYELFANEIHTNGDKLAPEVRLMFVSMLGNVFQRDNSQFQRDKFERACYEGKHIRKSISGRV